MRLGLILVTTRRYCSAAEATLPSLLAAPDEANHSPASQSPSRLRLWKSVERCLVNLRDSLGLARALPERESYSDCTLFAWASGGKSGFPGPPLSELDDAII